MKTYFVGALVLGLASVTAGAQDLKEGDKLQTLSNLRHEKQEIQSMNYQLPGRLPICSDVTVKKVGKGSITFDAAGTEYEFVLDKHTKGADISLQQAAQTYFGPKCDEAKIKSLSKADQEGIAAGRPAVGMTRQGVLYALGRPPFHANPSLEVSEWMYWRNRFGRMAVSFDEQGKVTNVR